MKISEKDPLCPQESTLYGVHGKVPQYKEKQKQLEDFMKIQEKQKQLEDFMKIQDQISAAMNLKVLFL